MTKVENWLVTGEMFWTSSPSSSSRVVEDFIHLAKHDWGKTGGSVLMMCTVDFEGGAKREGLVLYLTLGGGIGRGSSVTVIRLVKLTLDSGVCGLKCQGRVRAAAGASEKAH